MHFDNYSFSNKIVNMKKLLILILLATTVIACKKADTNPDPSNSTKDLVASSNFDWKTTKEITLDVIGLKSVNPEIKNILYVNSSIGDTVYYNNLLFMNTDYQIKFSVPSTENSVTLKYGTKVMDIDLVSNYITFDYIIE